MLSSKLDGKTSNEDVKTPHCPARFELILLATLLLFFLLFAGLPGILKKSPCFDEPAHIAGGLDRLLNSSHGFTADNGILPQMIEAFPLLFIEGARENSKLFEENHPPFEIQKKLLFSDPGITEQMIALPKLMALLFGMLGALLVYFASRKIFGKLGAFISLLAYCLCPEILAHSTIASSDIFVSIAFFACIASFWRLSHCLNFASIALFAVSLAFLCLSKMSFIIIAPVLPAIVLLRIISGIPPTIEIFRKAPQKVKSGAILMPLLIACLLSVLAAYAMIWTAYGFKYEMRGETASKEAAWNRLFEKTGAAGQICRFARDARIAPESFTYGFLSVYEASKQRYAFMNGELANNGWWNFFLYSFILKTPLPLIILLGIALYSIFSCKINPRPEAGEVCELRGFSGNKYLYELSPYMLFIVLYMIFAISSRINIGHRHLLPIYPPIFLICGACSIFAAKNVRGLFAPARIAILLTLLWLLAESIFISPHFLAYFNQLAGGPKNGYKHLVDSSLDWGQDLKPLSVWLKNNRKPGEPLYLSYFGFDSPERFDMDAKLLPGYHAFDREGKFSLKPGIYAVSATMLQFVYFPELFFSETGIDPKKIDDELFAQVKADAEKEISKYPEDPIPQSKKYKIYNMLRFAKLCMILRDRKPDAMIGYSILVYRLDASDIASILN